MRQIWIVLWVTLMLLQLITYWLAKQWDIQTVALDPELLELAKSTNREWKTLLPHDSAYGGESDEEAMFARESLFLELRKLERQLQQRGMDADVVNSLEKWHAVRQANLNGAHFNGYLKGILNWMESLADEKAGCLMERIYLLPDGGSDFPSAQVEMVGSPSAMGRRLARAVDDIPAMRVVELDLSKPGPAESWWMLGSCRYAGKALH